MSRVMKAGRHSGRRIKKASVHRRWSLSTSRPRTAALACPPSCSDVVERAALASASRVTSRQMSTPVVTEKWAGDLSCSVCRRKRLTATEFSKKAMEKHRNDPNAPMKCKTCVEAAAQQEQQLALEEYNAEGPNANP